MRNRTIVLACLTTAISGLAATAMPSAQAATGSVHIAKIYYNSPGSDTGSNSSLNAEWVTITNSTSSARSLKGWTLTDASSHKYTFKTFTLGAGKTVKVRTGSGDDTSATKYQDRGWYVWNNNKDTATLRRANGTKVDACSYNNASVASKTC